MEITGELVEETSVNDNLKNESDNNKTQDSTSVDNETTSTENDSEINNLLNHITNSPAIFKSQQIGDPELSSSVKRKIAEDLLEKNPVTFLNKFGQFLNEKHLNYLLNKYNESYEVKYYITNLKNLLSEHNRKIISKNRRYEAMKKMEAEGSYFSEAEMEKREPLLYHEMVGQFLSEKEKMIKNRESNKNTIPSFSSFLIDKIERDELDQLVKAHMEKGENQEEINSSSESDEGVKKQTRWGEDWEDKVLSQKNKTKKLKRQKKAHISAGEKKLLMQEFKSIMQNKFLDGKDVDFNYSDVDHNPEYDSIELRSRDEEEKYFDEETLDNSICTDTGIEDY